MTIGWPSASVSFGETSRAMMSFGPAGANGTIMRIGLDG
jgi:hypothetical protein